MYILILRVKKRWPLGDRSSTLKVSFFNIMDKMQLFDICLAPYSVNKVRINRAQNCINVK